MPPRGSVACLLDRQNEPFLAEAALIEIPERNVVGIQAKRIADLAKTLGDEAYTLESFKNFNPENRVSIIKIWPDLMNIVRETINTDLADSNGSNLLQRMRSHRGALDGELRTWESELGIKAKNIHMSISSAVRGQQSKISKLSKIGQPHDEKIQNLEGMLRNSEQKLKELNTDVEVHKKNLDAEVNRSKVLENELQASAGRPSNQWPGFLQSGSGCRR